MARKEGFIEKILRKAGYLKTGGRYISLEKDFEYVPEQTGKYRAKPISDYTALELYQRHPWIYACANLISSSIASLPLLILKKTEKGRELLSPSEIPRVFEIPNQYMSWYDLMEASVLDLELTGRAFWHIDKDEENKIIGLYRMRPDLVSIQEDKKRGITGYRYGGIESQKFYTPDNILFFNYFSPLGDFKGQGSTSAITTTATLDFYAQTYNKNFFKEGGTLSLFFKTDRSLSDAAFARLKDQLRGEYGGVQRSHKIGLGEEGLDVIELGTRPKDAQFIESKKQNLQEILAAFQVPPGLVGVLEYSSYANMKVQEREFWDKCIKTKLRKIEPKLDILAHYFNADWDTEFDLSGVEALQEDREIKTRIEREDIRIGLRTINEVRKERGLEPLPWGDERYDILKDRVILRTEGNGEKFLNSELISKRGERRRLIAESKEFMEAIFGIILKKFAEAGREIIKKLKGEAGITTVVGAGKAKSYLFDLGVMSKELRSIITPIIRKVFEKFGNFAMVDIGMGRSFDVYSPHAIKVIHDFTEKYFGEKGVPQKVYNELAIELDEGFKLGESVDDMTKRVMRTMFDYTQGEAWKARRIAATESLRAANYGTLEGYKQSGVVKFKTWLTAEDEKVCPICGTLDGAKIELDEVFSEGGFEADAPPIHPGCRCTILPEVMRIKK